MAAFGWQCALGVAAALPPGDLPQRLDQITRAGHERPAAAQAALDALPPMRAPGERRAVALARATVAVRSGTARSAGAALAQLGDAARDIDETLAQADAALMLALQAEIDESPVLAERARNALDGYARHCARQPVARADCEYRQRWSALDLLARHPEGPRDADPAWQHGLAALDAARAGADAWREAASHSNLAALAIARTDFGVAAQQLESARDRASALGDATLHARVELIAARLAQARGDPVAAQRAMNEAVELARQADAPRLEALLLANLTDLLVKTGQPQAALRATARALPIARRHQDKRVERALLHNAALAHVALGQGAAARRDFDRVQASWGADGANARRLTSMREFGDALATAGDLRGALQMHHREVELARQLMAASRSAALDELRTRYDGQAQQRRIDLLARDNALQSAALTNRQLTRQLWAFGGIALTLALALALLLLRHLRQANRRLADSQLLLRRQSERDALTGLANRRRLQASLHAAMDAPGFSAALLMIDVDHFKRINDSRGHAAGDVVLVEVAHRLAASARELDLVARWGGEEFLILAPGLNSAQAAALARRLLEAVAGTPVALPGASNVGVTVSIGHAALPLPPHGVPLTPEQAINLADMALYSAKGRGRNRAVGVAAVDAADAAALRDVEADFERACSDGRLRLAVTCGPAGTGTVDGTANATDTIGGPGQEPGPSRQREHAASRHSQKSVPETS